MADLLAAAEAASGARGHQGTAGDENAARLAAIERQARPLIPLARTNAGARVRRPQPSDPASRHPLRDMRAHYTLLETPLKEHNCKEQHRLCPPPTKK